MKALVIAGFIALGSMAQAETVAYLDTSGTFDADSTAQAGPTLDLVGGYNLYVSDPANYGYGDYTVSGYLSVLNNNGDEIYLYSDSLALSFDPTSALTTVDSSLTAAAGATSPIVVPNAMTSVTFALAGTPYALDTAVSGTYTATLVGNFELLANAAANALALTLPTLPPLNNLNGSGSYELSIELSKDVSNVPLPASGVLMLAAFGGLAVSRSRKS